MTKFDDDVTNLDPNRIEASAFTVVQFHCRDRVAARDWLTRENEFQGSPFEAPEFRDNVLSSTMSDVNLFGY